MVTTIQRWGNSLAIRIPKAFAAQARLVENSDVDISLEGDRIVVSPAQREWKLDDLVEKIKPANRHREIRWSDRTGKEAW
ncbi:MAG: AbrB/MazE/SpoVT family DNA-binding domain-containing protein [Gemmatimonadaceae bacterium]|nr:AbrB/MazE/SpoVT family DNA-binding domain-containing protein [Gemmatimonadaceae bacterium]